MAMAITSLSRERGSAGQIVAIRGRDFGAAPTGKIAAINRCRVYRAEVVSWAPTEVRVRIPSGLPAGACKVLIYYDATFRTSSNSLDLWVTASYVPATVLEPWEVQVRSTRLRYGKSAAWETWMLANSARYAPAFAIVRPTPCTLTLAFRYETTPIAYDPPWSSEGEHMRALELLSELTFPGYDFRFVFRGDPATSFASVIAGIASGVSRAVGRNVHLYYETILDHELGHVMGLPHHYDTLEQAGEGRHMPPGDDGCLMDRTRSQFCSGCRTALNARLDVDNEAAIDAAVNEILRRYPY